MNFFPNILEKLTIGLLLNQKIIFDLNENELDDELLIFDKNNIFIQRFHFLKFLNKKRLIFIKKNIKNKFILDPRVQLHIEEIYYRNIIYYMILINTFNLSKFQNEILVFNNKKELVRENYQKFILKDIQNFIFNEIKDFSEIQNRIFNTILIGNLQLGEFSYYLSNIFVNIFNKNKPLYLKKFKDYKKIIQF